jgi:hypothetical protein
MPNPEKWPDTPIPVRIPPETRARLEAFQAQLQAAASAGVRIGRTHAILEAIERGLPPREEVPLRAADVGAVPAVQSLFGIYKGPAFDLSREEFKQIQREEWRNFPRPFPGDPE